MNFFKYLLCIILSGLLLGATLALSTVPAPAGENTKRLKMAPCPEIVYDNDMITESDCGHADGSITGIQVISSGTKVLYTWRDNKNNIVGNKLDLVNIPAGVYTLEVGDNSSCGQSVYSNPFVIVDQNVVINGNNVNIKPSGCSATGSITGIAVTNATQYIWHFFNTQQDVTTPTPDLINVPPGSYELTATNDKGCSMVSAAYYVPPNAPLPGIINSVITQPTCSGEGSIAVTLLVASTSPTEPFFFADSAGIHHADGLVLPQNANPTIVAKGLDGGTYYLYVTGPDGCNYLLSTFKLSQGLLQIDTAASMVINDRCNQHIGSIVPVFDGEKLTPKVTMYTWKNANGTVVGDTKIISGLGAGVYSLRVFDPATRCFVTGDFTIINTSPALVPPVADNINLCLPATAGIAVKNIDTSGYYRLYANLTDSIPIATSKPGIFFEPVKETTDYYIAFKKADCESARTKVTVTVFADLTIPNAFTPNNDGINDYWNIAGIEKFPGADVSLFSRGGQLIFHSIGYGVPFDGRINGKELPVGVYYYIIDVHQSICVGKISGSLTLIR